MRCSPNKNATLRPSYMSYEVDDVMQAYMFDSNAAEGSLFLRLYFNGPLTDDIHDDERQPLLQLR